MRKPSLYGLVLAGGRSSRMGKDKGLLQYYNLPQREYLFDLLGKFCDRVFTSCRQEQGIAASLRPICDKFDFDSPLNGILSAMDSYPEKSWLVVAVDMPYVSEDVLRYLISNCDQTKVATCFYDSGGKLPEPLLTIWEPAALPLLRRFINESGISPRDFLVTSNCQKLMYSEPQFHVNINTPEEFYKVKNDNSGHLT